MILCTLGVHVAMVPRFAPGEGHSRREQHFRQRLWRSSCYRLGRPTRLTLTTCLRAQFRRLIAKLGVRKDFWKLWVLYTAIWPPCRQLRTMEHSFGNCISDFRAVPICANVVLSLYYP